MASKSPASKKTGRKPRAEPSADMDHEAGHEAVPADPPVPQTPEDLLRAGLKAFRLEHLMGWVPSSGSRIEPTTLGFPGLDSFGFRKFEDVFDQRVAGALARLGWPDTAVIEGMQAEIDRLTAEVEALRKAQRKSAPGSPARKTTARKTPARKTRGTGAD